jgi:hypothetical protein
VLGDVNEDHIVPELQLLERFHRLMIAAEAEAMDGQRCLATRSCVTNGLGGFATKHLLARHPGNAHCRRLARYVEDHGHSARAAEPTLQVQAGERERPASCPDQCVEVGWRREPSANTINFPRPSATR